MVAAADEPAAAHGPAVAGGPAAAGGPAVGDAPEVAGEPEVADAPAAVDEPAAVAGSRSRRLYAWRWRSQREPGERGQRATPSWCRSGSSALWSR
jgi:hypothetical protein|uniref:Uncharacterized protein n=1 Tax=Zea mays TaxID=4577 RepID=A0A804QBW8_MAIZE